MSYRILVLKSTGVAAPYVTGDLSEALSELGHMVHIVELKDLLSLPISSIIEFISSINPDFALMYGVSGLIRLQKGSRVTNLFSELDIPFACLICDNPELMLETLKWARSELMHLFVWDEAYADELKALGFKNVHPFSLATNPRRFKPRELTAEEARRFSVPLAFVGSIPKEESIRKLQAEISLPGLGEAVLKVKRAYPQWSCRQCLRALGDELGPEAKRELDFFMQGTGFEKLNLYLHWRLTFERRVQIVRLLELEGLAVWGNDEWPIVLRDAHTFRGSIDYETETPLLYQSAGIIIDVPSAQLLTSVNQRVFDVLAAGGFILTGFQRDLAKFFKLGEEICCYRTPNELLRLIRHFLSRPEDRKKIASAGRERVLREHTYVHRARELIEIMGGVIERRRAAIPGLLSTYARPVACNVCGCNDGQELFELTFSHGGAKLQFKMVRCKQCGLAYNNPQWTPEIIAAFYRETYHRTDNQKEHEAKILAIAVPCYERELDIIEDFTLPLRGGILDVGCGTGSFTAVAAARGWDAWGIDPYPDAIDTAKRIFGQCGGKYLEGYLESAHLPLSFFSAVVFNDVLEHVHHPKRTLLRARELLVPDGLVVVTVPDIESVVAKLQGPGGQHWDSPYHLYGFTRPVIKRLIEEAGFRVLKCCSGLMYPGQILVIARKQE